MDVLSSLSNHSVFKYFIELSQIPRPSRHEERARAWVLSYAKQWNRKYRCDDFGNITVEVAATSEALRNAPTVAIQAHLDMVCEKDERSTDIDFMTDPLVLETSDDETWLTAQGTTLGADNGIAVAMQMALMDPASTSVHGPLELLFTLDEETGLTGANNLGAHMITAPYLLNIDSSEEGFFCIGCAGGQDLVVKVPLARTALDDAMSAYVLTVSGLSGGHSGMEIFDGRGNAIKILEWALSEIQSQVPLYISELYGGEKRNAIPRFAKVHLWCNAQHEQHIRTLIRDMMNAITVELPAIDHALSITLSAIQTAENTEHHPSTVFTKHTTERILAMIRTCPYGVQYRNSLQSIGTTTSNNLASVRTTDEYVSITNSSRFANEFGQRHMARTLDAIFHDSDITRQTENKHPAWRTSTQSKLCNLFVDEYKRQYNNAIPVVNSVHAGIECAVIQDRIPHPIEMLSLGPEIQYLHSPKERLHIESTKRTWNLIETTLSRVGELADGLA